MNATTPPAISWAVVIPTIGRPSLATLLDSMNRQEQIPDELVVVDDRCRAGDDLPTLGVRCRAEMRIVITGGRGPAAARNAGWRMTSAAWVVFLDDDVLLPAEWSAALVDDLSAADRDPGRSVAGVQGRVLVPLPTDRRPTDGQRGTAGLANARWITADMAYRRTALQAVHGFDERFPRAFREDADLAVRVRRHGYSLVRGNRQIVHPVRPADDLWISVRQQRGNADDALMRRLHGRRWAHLAQCPTGRLPAHVLTVASAVTFALTTWAGRRRTAGAAAAVWAALTAQFTVQRIVPGPRTGTEVRAMMLTSPVIPFAALGYRLAGWWRHRRAGPWTGPSGHPVRAVLFDRDGTLVHDVPYNGDPSLVRPVDGAARALQRLRDKGIAVGVITNQSGIGRGLLSVDQVAAVNARVERELGPFGSWQVCPHTADDACVCRKPRPEMVRRAAADLGVSPREVVVVGDIGTDVEAARSAGSRAILVPTSATRTVEFAAAPCAPSLSAAVDAILGGRI